MQFKNIVYLGKSRLLLKFNGFGCKKKNQGRARSHSNVRNFSPVSEGDQKLIRRSPEVG